MSSSPYKNQCLCISVEGDCEIVYDSYTTEPVPMYCCVKRLWNKSITPTPPNQCCGRRLWNSLWLQHHLVFQVSLRVYYWMKTMISSAPMDGQSSQRIPKERYINPPILCPIQNICVNKITSMPAYSDRTCYLHDGPLWGESTGHWVIPSQSASNSGFVVLFDVRLSKQFDKQSGRQWFGTPWHLCDVTTMIWHKKILFPVLIFSNPIF